MFLRAQSPTTRRQNTTYIHVTFLPTSTSSSALPRFSSTSSARAFSVSASSAVGAAVGSVSATTLRPGVTRLAYRVVGGNVDDRFVVDSASGQLRVARPLTEYWRLPSATVELWVEARDDGRPPLFDAVPVTVSIQPINGDPPRFVRDTYSATVTEEAPAPVDVLTVTAADRDLGEAGRITYSLGVVNDNDEVISSSAFTIDEQNGQISTAATIDREQTAAYQLVVYSSDHVSHTGWSPLLHRRHRRRWQCLYTTGSRWGVLLLHRHTHRQSNIPPADGRPVVLYWYMVFHSNPNSNPKITPHRPPVL